MAWSVESISLTSFPLNFIFEFKFLSFLSKVNEFYLVFAFQKVDIIRFKGYRGTIVIIMLLLLYSSSMIAILDTSPCMPLAFSGDSVIATYLSRCSVCKDKQCC